MPTLSAPILDGQVLGGGAPIANSTVTLWAAGDRAPKQLGQARSGADGRFTIPAPATVAGSPPLPAPASISSPKVVNQQRTNPSATTPPSP